MEQNRPPVYNGDGSQRRRRKYHLIPITRFTAGASDSVFFVFAGIAATALTFQVLVKGLNYSWLNLLFLVGFWAVTAYLTLPRLHAIFTRIYVPDYFIGRTRTTDGLLGDPVNLGFRGREEQIHDIMLRAGWSRADDVTLKSSWGIVRSTLGNRSYPEAPVSPLKLFGRTQDFAYQLEVDGNPGKRHHVRFWKAPEGWALPGGQRVDWVAAATYDTGVGFSFFTLQITHRIDAETDYERDFILDTIRYIEPGTSIDVIKDFSTGYHSRNGGGDNIVTDGDLPIIYLVNDPRSSHKKVKKKVDLHSAHDIARSLPMNVLVGSIMVILWALTQCALLLYQLRNPIDLDAILAREPTVHKIVDAFGFTRVLDSLEKIMPGLIIAFTVLVLLVCWRLLKGSSRGRILALDLLALSFIMHMIRTWAWGEETTFNTVVIPMSILVFAMLAFTSDQARMYTEEEKLVKTPWLSKKNLK